MKVIVAAVAAGLLGTTLSAAVLTARPPHLGASLDQEEGFGWQLQPALLAHAPAWRAEAWHQLNGQSSNLQGFDADGKGGELLFPMPFGGRFALDYSSYEISNITPSLVDVVPGTAAAWQLAWASPLSPAWSLGAAATMGPESTNLSGPNLTDWQVGTEWRGGGQGLALGLEQLGQDGSQLQVLASLEGALLPWLGYSLEADLRDLKNVFWHCALDTRTALRFSVGYNTENGVQVGLTWAWRVLRPHWNFGSSVSRYGVALQDWSRPAEPAEKAVPGPEATAGQGIK